MVSAAAAASDAVMEGDGEIVECDEIWAGRADVAMQAAAASATTARCS